MRLSTFTFIACLAAVGCAPKGTSQRPASPIHQAYKLMNQGHNARAIVVLEEVAAKEPQNREVQLLLASAYVGEAGIDVYRVHTSFQDVLFGKPLSESFWGGGGGGSDKIADLLSEGGGLPETPGNPVGKVVEATPTPGATPTPKADPSAVEKLMDRLDRALAQLKKVVSFFNRFPSLEKSRWPYIEKALEHMGRISNPDRDILAYRAFVRIVYVKAFLQDSVIGDKKAGTKEWACSLDFSRVQEEATWVSRQLSNILADLEKAGPGKSTNFTTILAINEGLVEALEESQDPEKSGLPPGSQTGLDLFSKKVRAKFKCDQ